MKMYVDGQLFVQNPRSIVYHGIVRTVIFSVIFSIFMIDKFILQVYNRRQKR